MGGLTGKCTSLSTRFIVSFLLRGEIMLLGCLYCCGQGLGLLLSTSRSFTLVWFGSSATPNTGAARFSHIQHQTWLSVCLFRRLILLDYRCQVNCPPQTAWDLALVTCCCEEIDCFLLQGSLMPLVFQQISAHYHHREHAKRLNGLSALTVETSAAGLR